MLRSFIILFFLVACKADPAELNEVKPLHKPITHFPTKSKSKTSFEITTVQSPTGWGYQIRQNGKLLLDQPTIPGRSGNDGFQTQADAQRVAELVKTKLQAKIFPPTVSEDDLKNLNIH